MRIIKGELHPAGRRPFGARGGRVRHAFAEVVQVASDRSLFFICRKQNRKWKGKCRNWRTKKVAVIMGSDSDLPVVKGAIDTLKGFGIGVEVHVMSAHRTPALACEFAASGARPRALPRSSRRRARRRTWRVCWRRTRRCRSSASRQILHPRRSGRPARDGADALRHPGGDGGDDGAQNAAISRRRSSA